MTRVFLTLFLLSMIILGSCETPIGDNSLNVATATPSGTPSPTPLASASATPTTSPSPGPTQGTVYVPPSTIGQVFIIKLDDVRNDMAADVGWSSYLEGHIQAYEQVILPKNIKASYGIVSSKTDADTEEWVKKVNAEGRVEFWNHGFDHSKAADNSWYEFDGKDLEWMTAHLDDSTAWAANLGITYHTIGTPYNQNDATFNTLLQSRPQYKVVLLPQLKNATTLNISDRCNMEPATGELSYDHFVENYEARADKPVLTSQGHPGDWSPSEITEFGRIVDYLIGKGVTFMTPYEYYLWVNTGATPAPTQPTPTPDPNATPTPVPTPKTILINDTFASSLGTWGLVNVSTSTAASTASVVNGEVKIAITNGSTATTHIMFKRSSISIENGVSYTFSFRARGEAARTLEVELAKEASPYTSYSTVKSYNLTTAMSDYSFTFTMNEASDPGARLRFRLGKSTVGVYLDDFVLKRN